MSTIFISHSSQDSFEALALRNWLASEGWEDVFLDLDPKRGIAAGERWERALHAAATRCEAIVFLVSANWLASNWCLKEYALARGLNKKLFAALIDPAKTISDLPPELTGVWQIVDLTGGQDLKLFATQAPGSHEERHVGFSKSALLQLKHGLEKAGLDPKFFAWPPEHEPDRAPYRGLKPFEAEDAGIFFGRDAPIVEAIDRMRGLELAAPPRLFVILGASGAGKSSFLRAGLLPRLERDDSHFIPLKVIRPERAALTGESGLVNAIAAALPTCARADLRAAVQSGPGAVRSLIAEIVKTSAARQVVINAAARPPTAVIAIDQAEELFRAEGRQESEALLAILGELASRDDPAVVVIFAIRSDSYDALEHAKPLEGQRQVALPLLPMPRGAYGEVIEGPARRFEQAGGKLAIEPRLTQRLLTDIEAGGGSDALPLLAFTLEQLYLDYRNNGVLGLAGYETFGGLKGAIDAAVERALIRADADGRIPRDRGARLMLLRRGLIPWLAGIDPDSKAPRRNIARRSDIPVEAAPLIDLLAEERLLSLDTAVWCDVETGEETRFATIEPTHEALLRQWGTLDGWLKEDFGLLATLESIKRAARDWEANARADAWLSHQGQRLADAFALDARGDIAAMLGATDHEYLRRCRAKEERQAAKNRRERLHRALAVASIAFLALALVVGAPWAYAELSKEKLIATEAARTDLRGQIIAYAVVDGGLEQDTAPGVQTSPYTTPLLARLAQRDKSMLDAIQEVHQDVIALTNGSQRPFLATSMNGSIFLWRQPQTRAKKAIVLSVDDPGFCCVLDGPVHDGDAIYALLRKAGFRAEDMIRIHNVGRRVVEDKVKSVCRAFSEKEANLAPTHVSSPKGNTLLVFFFSGHGATIGDRKYLITSMGKQPPANADVLSANSVDLTALQDEIERCASASVVIIDTHFPTPSLDFYR